MSEILEHIYLLDQIGIRVRGTVSGSTLACVIYIVYIPGPTLEPKLLAASRTWLVGKAGGGVFIGISSIPLLIKLIT